MLWQQRCLSFQGKSLVANALAHSGLWYLAKVLPLPDSLFSTINKLLYKFFWSNKKELVNRTTTYLDKLSGGFGVVDVRLKVWALHVQWIKRFILSPNKWDTLFTYYVQRCFGTTNSLQLLDLCTGQRLRSKYHSCPYTITLLMLTVKLHMGEFIPLIQCVTETMILKLSKTCSLTALLLNLSFYNFKLFLFVLPIVSLSCTTSSSFWFWWRWTSNCSTCFLVSLIGLNSSSGCLVIIFVSIMSNHLFLLFCRVGCRLFFLCKLYAKRFQSERNNRYFWSSWKVIIINVLVNLVDGYHCKFKMFW